MPGTLNYVEGQASVGDQAVTSNSVGSVELQPGQTISTENGKAEVLLTPGVFLRLGANSSARMVSNSLSDTQVKLDKGRALVEVAELYKQNNIAIREDGATTQLEKTGLYGFDADQQQVRVLKGKAEVRAGDQHVTVKGGHKVSLLDSTLKSQKFDQRTYEDSDLYRWSSLRSSYLADANVQVAHLYVDTGWWGPGWASGWYWDPWFGGYTFLPASGIFYSPFGWNYYSPVVIYRNPGFYPAYPSYRVPPQRFPEPYVNGRVEPRMGPEYRPGVSAPRAAAPMTHSPVTPAMHAPPAMPRSGGSGGGLGGAFHGVTGGELGRR